MESLEESLARIDDAVDHAIIDSVNKKVQTDHRLVSQYLGLKAPEAQKTNAQLIQIRRTDEQFCQTTNVVGQVKQQSIDGEIELRTITSRLDKWTGRCRYEKICQGLREEMKWPGPTNIPR